MVASDCQGEYCHERGLLLRVEDITCSVFPLDYYRWTDLVHVPCQRFTRPGALPLWRGALRPARLATYAEGGGGADPTGRPCRHSDTCQHAGMADGAQGRVTHLGVSPDLQARAGLRFGTEVVKRIAQFLAVCSASTRAVELRVPSPFSSQVREKRGPH